MKIPYDNPKELSEQDKNNAVAAAMIKHGKPSISALGMVLLETGQENCERIKKNCPKTWNLYSNIANRDDN